MFEWDEKKSQSNKVKHGLSFEDGIPALSDDYALTIEDHGHDEQRWQTIGMGRYLIVVHVAYTFRNQIRIISVRKAEKHERREYERRRK